MRQSVLRSFAITLLVFLMSGCDSIPFMESKSEYKGAGRSKPLEVPPDLTSMRSSSAFNVPGAAVYSASAMNQNPETEEQTGLEPVLADVKNVRMVKAGSQRWLVVNAPPEKIWPVVRNFWLDQGFAVRVENPDIGLMETEWLDSDAIKPKEDNRGYREKFDNWLDGLSGLADRRKFRTRLEHGENEGTTEIYMTHLTVASAPDDGKNYVVTMLGKVDTGYRPDAQEKKNTSVNQFDNDLDAELLRRLMVKLGLSEASADTVAAQAAPDKHADVVKESDQSITLKLNEPFDRAWRRVGLALDRIGFVTEDKNRSEGIFYVRYADSEAEDPIKVKKGLLERLKFWKSDDEEKSADAQTQPPKQMDKSKFWNGTSDGDKSSKQYRIQVLENAGETSDVYVLTQENKRNTTTTANRIISLLYDQLK